MEKGEIIEQNNRKVKGRKIGTWRERDCDATLSGLYPSPVCLAWEALPGV